MDRLGGPGTASPLCYSGRRLPGELDMAAAKPTYDLMVLLDTGAPDEQRAKILADAERLITSNGGEITSKHDWGVRALAFEIRHKTDAEYHLLQFHGVRETLEALQRMLRITDGVVRFRIIKLKPGTPAPPSTRPEPRPTGIGEPVAVEPVPVPVAAAPADE